MRPDQTMNELSARVFAGIDAVLAREQPDWLLVQGDTTTAMCAAIAAFHRRVRVGHVEAGLRTGDFDHPFPEEMNRRVVDLVSAANFVPTRRAARALEAEDVPGEKIFLTGNTVVDALLAIAGHDGETAAGGPGPDHDAPPRELRRAARARRARHRPPRREPFRKPASCTSSIRTPTSDRWCAATPAFPTSNWSSRSTTSRSSG